ncbi:cytochrome P450 2L1-like [Penaeus japonicus]|uniref:cytochrome P450 2L1-like n=1 Tax=Penaeus japonicus TaxID=27405 RepID=UPI001C70BC33|nr:cytochrome P450 2L1-like [Penaeus japonicus]
MAQHLDDLHKKHGDIFLWRMGTQVMVFLHGYPICKEALGRAEFTNRPDWEGFKFFEEVPLGVIASNGHIWQSNRRFSLRQLRDLGMGKSRLVAAVQEQALKMVGALKEQAGKPEPVPHSLKVAVVNVIWQMIASKQFDLKHPKLQEFESIINEAIQFSTASAIPDFLPWINYVLPYFVRRRVFKLDLAVDLKVKFMDYFGEWIEDHRRTLDRENPRDLIDAYLLEMEEEQGKAEAFRSDRDLFILILDLYFAGSETVANTLTFMIFYLAAHPDVQRKLQDEIDQVLPEGTLPSMEDKIRLPYTEAVIHETLRRSSVAALGVQHVAMSDTTLGPYFIPKGTILNTNINAVHHDRRYWDDPEKFSPERWLDDQGKFVARKDGFMPFSIGKRVCLGEALARMELLIMTAAIFQALSVTSPPEGQVDSSPDPVNPFGHIPRKEKVVFSLRS